MTPNPLQQPCFHVATTEEKDRDPAYEACDAAPGEPCAWARRHDGLADPAFHADRLETAANAADPDSALDTETFREAILETGLV